jgi:hypothetical protein
VDPTGTKALCGTYFGVRPECQEEHGSRERVSLLDLQTGVVEPLVGPYVGGDERLEREHSSWCWLRRATAKSSVLLDPDVVATSVTATSALNAGNYESAADQARNLTVACMRAMVRDSPEQSNPHFAPEALRAIAAMKAYGPDRLAELESWLEQVSGMMPIFAPPGDNQARRRWFRNGWQSVTGTSSAGIEWRQHRFPPAGATDLSATDQ